MQSIYSISYGINTIKLDGTNQPKYFSVNASTIRLDSTPDDSYYMKLTATLEHWIAFLPGVECRSFGLNNCPHLDYANPSIEYDNYIKFYNYEIQFNKYSMFVASAVNMGILQVSDLTMLTSNITARGKRDPSSIGKGANQGEMNFYVL